MSHELAKANQTQVVSIRPPDQMLHCVEAGDFDLPRAIREKGDMVETREATPRLHRVIPLGPEHRRLQGRASVDSSPVCGNDVIQLVQSSIRTDKSLEV